MKDKFLNLFKSTVVLFSIATMFSCASDDGNSNAPGPVTASPDFVINAASDITVSAANLTGSVNGDNIAEVGFIYSTSSELNANSNPEALGSNSGDIDYVLSGLAEGTIYYYAAYAKNSDGDFFKSETKSFTTLEFQDPEPNFLNIVSINPINGSSNFSKDGSITLIFDEAVDVFSNTNTNFGLRRTDQSTTISVDLSARASTKELIVKPDNPLEEGRSYTLFIKPGFKSLSGKTLSTEFSSTFKVGGSDDFTKPTVVSINPADNATGVPLDKAITIVFSEPMRRASLVQPNIKLTKGITTIDCAFTYSGDRTVTLTPVNDLQKDSEYFVSYGLAEDASGNSVGNIIDGASFKTVRFVLGDAHQGGIIFNLDAAGEHGLIAAPQDQTTGSNFNTAVTACTNYNGGGFTDWYLPSISELEILYDRRNLVGGFTPIAYWSQTSVQLVPSNAWGVFFGTGSNAGKTFDYDKSNTFQHSRAIRAF